MNTKSLKSRKNKSIQKLKKKSTQKLKNKSTQKLKNKSIQKLKNKSTQKLKNKSIQKLKNETDPSGLSPHTPGAKLDEGKPMAYLMLSGFSRALLSVAEVTTHGAKKYSPNGWEQVENGQDRYADAAVRHLLLIKSEGIDKASGLPHIAMAAWNILATLELRIRSGELFGENINLDEIERIDGR